MEMDEEVKWKRMRDTKRASAKVIMCVISVVDSQAMDSFKGMTWEIEGVHHALMMTTKKSWDFGVGEAVKIAEYDYNYYTVVVYDYMFNFDVRLH